MSIHADPPTFFDKFKKYHFELKHLFVLFIVLIIFLVLVSFVQKTSLQGLLLSTQDWYQQDSAEKMANLTATSLELLMETTGRAEYHTPEEKQNIIQAFNILLSQQKLQQNIEEICILVNTGKALAAIESGQVLYEYFFEQKTDITSAKSEDQQSLILYKNKLQELMIQNEQIYSVPEGD